MLKQRVITALVVAPLIIMATLWLPTPMFAVLAALVFALGAWEWAHLAGFQGTSRYTYTAVLLLLFGLMNRLVVEDPSVALGVIVIGLVWWLVALMQVLLFPSGSGFWKGTRAARSVAGGLVLIPAVTGLVLLHQLNPVMTLLVMVLVSSADTGAYFAGKAFGRHKLAPSVSPGKTWEGLAGGVLLVVAVGIVAAYLLEVHQAVYFVLLCVLTVLISVVGDLIESMFKRLAGAKDSGSILPGHGGVLDRVDSLTAAAPMFAIGLSLLKVSS